MRITVLGAFWVLFVFFTPSLHNAGCNAAVIQGSEGPDALAKRSERMVFWEKCEDEWNEDKNRMDRCCKGNYKCSDEKCKGKGLCKILSLWCYSNTCEAKDKKDKKDKDKKDKDKKDKDKKDKDKKDKDKKDKDKKDKDKKDKDKKDKDKKDKDKKDKDKKDKDKKDKDKDKKDKDEETEEEEVYKEEDDDDEEQATPSPTPSRSPVSSPTPSRSPRPSPSPSPAPAQREFDPLNCNGGRIRREVRDLSPSEREKWQQAILRMRADRDENGNSEWDNLVRLHMQNSDEAHGGSYFLPWHRLYLLRLENALRRYEPDLALPYWDWTIDAHDAATSTVWGPGYFGGARAGNQPIPDGPFQGMDGRYPSQHIVRRNFNSGSSGAIPQLWRMNALNDVINANTFEAFSDGIESAHALPHIYIGGDMGDSWLAPNDPIFGLHHAFVDRLYSMRQGRRGATDFGGTHDFQSNTENAASGRVFDAFGVPVSRAFNLGCVSYEAPRLQGRTIDGGRGTPEDACENEAFRSGHSMSSERCERGNALLQGTS